MLLFYNSCQTQDSKRNYYVLLDLTFDQHSKYLVHKFGELFLYRYQRCRETIVCHHYDHNLNKIHLPIATVAIHKLHELQNNHHQQHLDHYRVIQIF